MATYTYPSPPDTSTLQVVYGNYAGVYGLLQLFSTGLPELQLNFSPEHFMAFYDDFRERETAVDLASPEDVEPAVYWIEGKDCWIRVCLEAHEGYYGWNCFTSADRVGHYRAYFFHMYDPR
ncbi:hypothetical protein [Parapedobacter sp. DT-150]|uniref:hypothetical protein n=1 Tax=Parapedobacter sp. DT-150 TaxID=3396162 RepID=UPI003F19FDC0